MPVRSNPCERVAALWMVRRRFLSVPGTDKSGAGFVTPGS